MIRVVARLLREPDVQGRGRQDVDKWISIVEHLQLLFQSHGSLGINGYWHPMSAFQLSVQGMDMEKKQLLAVLRHFPPVQEVPMAVVKAVWQGVRAPQDAALFETVLQKLKRMNVVDLHQREHYGFNYGVLLKLVMTFHAMFTIIST
jgi:hypothetical protein